MNEVGFGCNLDAQEQGENDSSDCKSCRLVKEGVVDYQLKHFYFKELVKGAIN